MGIGDEDVSPSGEAGRGWGKINLVPVPIPAQGIDLIPISVPILVGDGDFSPMQGGAPPEKGIRRPVAISTLMSIVTTS